MAVQMSDIYQMASFTQRRLRGLKFPISKKITWLIVDFYPEKAILNKWITEP